jgi:phage tail sheath gpL-like
MAEIPLAIAPSTRTPGVGLLVDLKAGAPSPGTGVRRAVILAVKSSSGTITPDTELKQSVSGEAEVSALLGPGVFGHLCAKRLFEEHGLAQVDLASPAAPAGALATLNVVFAGTVTVSQTFKGKVAGRPIEFTWIAGETAIQAATKYVAKVNEKTNDLPVTVDNTGGSSATAVVTCKIAGTIGNDVVCSGSLSGGSGGTINGGASFVTNLSGGTLEPDFANVLGLIQGRGYRFILPVVGNTDAQSTGATGAPGRVKTHINLYATGVGAKLQQSIFGHTGALSSLKAGPAAHNYERHEFAWAKSGLSLPCEYQGAEAGARLRDEAILPNVNRAGYQYRATLYGPENLVTGSPTGPEVEDALQSGVSPVNYTESGSAFMVRAVSGYFKLSGGAPDDRVLDVVRVTSVDEVAEDIRIFLQAEYPNMNIIDALEEGEELPENVVEINEIKDAVNGRMGFWIRRGVVNGKRWRAAVANGTYVCRVNPSDGGQVDLVIPSSIVRNLVKFSAVVQQRDN